MTSETLNPLNEKINDGTVSVDISIRDENLTGQKENESEGLVRPVDVVTM